MTPCPECRHSVVEPQPGADNLLCTLPAVRTYFGRERVAASVAHDGWCHGRLYRAREASGGATARPRGQG